jgi:hypothetical protein
VGKSRIGGCFIFMFFKNLKSIDALGILIQNKEKRLENRKIQSRIGG